LSLVCAEDIFDIELSRSENRERWVLSLTIQWKTTLRVSGIRRFLPFLSGLVDVSESLVTL